MEIFIFVFCLYKHMAYKPTVFSMFCVAKDDDDASAKAQEFAEENFGPDKGFVYVHISTEIQDKLLLKGMLDNIVNGEGKEEESEEWADSIG